MTILATFKHEAGYKFNIQYKTKRGFVRAVLSSRYAVLDNAVDFSCMKVVTPKSFNEYGKGNKHA